MKKFLKILIIIILVYMICSIVFSCMISFGIETPQISKYFVTLDVNKVCIQNKNIRLQSTNVRANECYGISTKGTMFYYNIDDYETGDIVYSILVYMPLQNDYNLRFDIKTNK